MADAKRYAVLGGAGSMGRITVRDLLEHSVEGDEVLIADYERMLSRAGFTAVQVLDARKDLGAYAQANAAGCCPSAAETSCCGSPAEGSFHGGLAQLLARYDVNDYAASVQVYALKP